MALDGLSVFWFTLYQSTNVSIFTASTAGTNTADLFDQPYGNITAIAVDANRIYFGDQKNQSLSIIPKGQATAASTLATEPSSILDLKIADGVLYWVTEDGRS